MKKESQRDIMLRRGYLTPADAADRIGVNICTIYRMVQLKKVEVVRAPSDGPIYLLAPSLAEHYKEAPPLYERIMEGVEQQKAAAASGRKKR